MLKLDGVSKVYRVGTFGGKELHAVSNVSTSSAVGSFNAFSLPAHCC